jgi:hypothetical protein
MMGGGRRVRFPGFSTFATVVVYSKSDPALVAGVGKAARFRAKWHASGTRPGLPRLRIDRDVACTARMKKGAQVFESGAGEIAREAWFVDFRGLWVSWHSTFGTAHPS